MTKKLNLEQKIVIFLPILISIILVPLVDLIMDFANSGKINYRGVSFYYKAYISIFSWYQLLPLFLLSFYLSTLVKDSTRKFAYIQLVSGLISVLLFYLVYEIIITVPDGNTYNGFASLFLRLLRPLFAIPILYTTLFISKGFFKNKPFG